MSVLTYPLFILGRIIELIDRMDIIKINFLSLQSIDNLLLEVILTFLSFLFS